MRNEIAEGARVSLVTTVGFIASRSLADVSAIVSIMVGLMTLLYIGSKTYFLFRNQGRGRDE